MTKKIALITGASSGLGRELAIIHAKLGGNLVIVARREERLKTLANYLEKAYGTKVIVIKKDLSKPSAPKEVYDTIKSRNIEIDFLINNAGFGGWGEFYKVPLEKHINIIDLNVIALTKLTHLFLNDFIERGSGKVLNVSSAVALMSGPLQSVYCATKGYIMSLSNALAFEVKDTNVTVTTLIFGATRTEFAKVANMRDTDMFKSMASPIDVAYDGYVGMIKGKLNVYSGLSIWKRFLLCLVKVVPRKFTMSRMYKLQQKKHKWQHLCFLICFIS